jgi:hypothetical protein
VVCFAGNLGWWLRNYAGVSIGKVVYLWERWGENRFGIGKIRDMVGLN